jgi:predicted dehydrogenase
VDTVHAVATTQTGRNGTIAISFGTEFKRGTQIEILTTAGSVIWTPANVKTVVKNEKGEMVEEVKEFKPSSTGVDREVVAFGEAIRKGELEVRQTPAEALKDLEILQGLLQSGEANGVVKSVGA